MTDADDKCPKCEGRREVVTRVVDGRPVRVTCSVCRGAGKLPPAARKVFLDERAALEDV